MCAGGTPALPGGLPPPTSWHQGDNIAEAFGCCPSLKEFHPYSCLFVSIRGSSLLAVVCLYSKGSQNSAGFTDLVFH